MRAPDPPIAPDPYRVAAAQQLSNIETAEANAALANADEETPEAISTFEQIAPVDITTYQYDSSGNLVGTTDREVPRWKRVTTLKPTQQTLFDQQQTLAQNFNTWAINQINQLQAIMVNPLDASNLTDRREVPTEETLVTTPPTPGALVTTIGSTDLTAHLQTTREAVFARPEYNVQRDREKMINELDLQGVYPGSKAYDRALDSFDKATNDLWLQSWTTAQQEQTRIIQLEGMVASFANGVQQMQFDQAVSVIDVGNSNLLRKFQLAVDLASYINTLRQIELQEEITIRAQTVNEVSALVNGGQVNVPRFQPYQGGTVASTPVGDYAYRSAAYRLNSWQQSVQQQQQMFGGVLGLAGNLAGGALALGGGLRG